MSTILLTHDFLMGWDGSISFPRESVDSHASSHKLCIKQPVEFLSFRTNIHESIFYTFLSYFVNKIVYNINTVADTASIITEYSEADFFDEKGAEILKIKQEIDFNKGKKYDTSNDGDIDMDTAQTDASNAADAPNII
ncbi:hypothetical protein AYI70_g11527 [Smittium culicis]|uniref:Uncharacterized protein n=1 Tax=Smittium culicis TaxID=133412 RepID=A0A1R1X1H3_9FUNG|nr:hypothetical protein AYI70_g11527 [Smittium culicis]